MVKEIIERQGDFIKTAKYYKNDVEKIVESLKENGVIATRTDTVMGLMIVSDQQEAIDKLRNVKQRPEEKLFPVMVSSVEMMKTICEVSDRDLKIIEEFLPGQLTLILKQRDDSELLLESETVAVRIVEDDTLMKVVEMLNKPIFLTSANKSGDAPTKLAEEVLEIFDNEIEGVIMNDAYGYRASTILDLSTEDMKILRDGDITLEDIQEVMEER